MQISVVIPLKNEEESLEELAGWIERVMIENNFTYEIIFIDDGSTDGSWEVIKKLSAAKSNIKGIRFRRNYGKSAALNTGFAQAEGAVVITMDADLQDSPDEIPALYGMIAVEKYDLVSGWKQKRHDPISKTLPTKLFNGATRVVSGIKLNDFNCGLKAYKRDVVKSIEVYGEMHRYIPVLAKWAGFTKIGEKVVTHYPRKFGTTKFGMERFVNGFLDLMSITFMGRFAKRPMHFFGTIGSIFFLIGFGIAAWLIIDKLWNYWILDKGISRDITDQPIFYLALATLIIGVQLFLAGFLGELISRTAGNRNFYHIKDSANL